MWSFGGATRMNDKIVQTIVDHVLEHAANGAASVVGAIANRIGSGAVRAHLDAYDAARTEADAAEDRKFGPMRLFSKWIK